METVITNKDVILTGVYEVDRELGGGIPVGSLVLIEGQSGTGKSALCQYLAYNTLLFNEDAVAYYATDNSIKGLVKQMDSMSLNSLDYLLTDKFRIYPLNSQNGYRATRESLILLVSHLTKLSERFKLVIIDSMTILMNHISPVSQLDFFSICRNICERGRTILLVADSRSFEKGMISRLHSLCDDHISFRSEEVGNRLIKLLAALKLRGADYPARAGVSFEILPDTGIRVLPYSKVNATPR